MLETKMFMFNLFIVCICIMLAQITEAYNMYVLDKDGHLSKQTGVIHIDSKDLSEAMRERLVKQVDEYLRQPKKGVPSHFSKMMPDKSKKKKREPEYKSGSNSPVGYSNGRYTLDLDKIDVRDLHDVSKKSDEVDDEYFDPAESFRDYYDYVSINDRLATNDKIPWRQLKHLTKYLKSRSLRKYNRLLGDEKYFRTKDIDTSTENKKFIKKRKKYNPKKRFQIIDNSKLNRKKKKYGRNSDDSTENKSFSDRGSEENVETKKHDSDFYNSAEQNQDFSAEEKPKKHKKKKNKHEKKKHGDDSDDNKDEDAGVYLQGNVIINLKGNHDSAEKDEGSDTDNGRRRLPHFLPKRYHWDPEEIHKLGYFWFNGPKGKYPAPVPVD